MRCPRLIQTPTILSIVFPSPMMMSVTGRGAWGYLTRREDDELSDGDWLAFQHRAWAGQLRQLHAEVRRLQWALARGVDPTSGRPPRQHSQWDSIQRRIKEAIERTQSVLNGLLDDYACHFGDTAADRFGGYVMKTLGHDNGQPAQVELF